MKKLFNCILIFSCICFYVISQYFESNTIITYCLGTITTLLLVSVLMIFLKSQFCLKCDVTLITVLPCILIFNRYHNPSTTNKMFFIALSVTLILVPTVIFLSKKYKTYKDKLIFSCIYFVIVFIFIGQSLLYCNYIFKESDFEQIEVVVTKTVYESPSSSSFDRSFFYNEYAIIHNTNLNYNIDTIIIKKSIKIEENDVVKLKCSNGLFTPIYRVIT